MLIFLLLIVSSSLIIFPLVRKLNHQKLNEKPFRPPPGPKGFPIIGNLLQYDFSKPHEYFSNLGIAYGPIVGLRLGHVPVVVVQSSKLAKEVMQTQDLNFCSRPSLVGIRRISYNGLDVAFAPYGDYFREIKKLTVVHLLSSKRVESFGSIRQEEVSRLIDKISVLASNSQVVNLSELMMGFGSSNICRIAFGKRYEEDEGLRSRFHSLLNEVQALFVGFFFTDYFPYLGWLDKLTGQFSRLERVFKDFDTFYEEIINNHLDPNRPKAEQEDIIDVLLQLKRERSFAFELTFDHIKALLMTIWLRLELTKVDEAAGETRSEVASQLLARTDNGPDPFSRKLLRAEVIFVAGTDTSAALIVWAMTELVKSTDALKNVQDEVRNIAGDKGYIVEKDLPKLKYLKAVVKETLRLHPAAPLLVARETIRKTMLNGYDILPKTLVHVNAWAIGRDPHFWKHPKAFIPERFLGSIINYRGHDFELVPFGAGRRSCPGMALGVANMELALANLLCTFNWQLPYGMKKEDIDTDVIPGITMHKKNPLCLIANKFSNE